MGFFASAPAFQQESCTDVPSSQQLLPINSKTYILIDNVRLFDGV
jgi:hypothetical protein